METKRTIAKDFHDLMKNINSFSGGQATITKWDDENLGTFEVTISPNDGSYKEGEFVFQVVIKSLNSLPKCYCKTAIYHPNIDTIQNCNGAICFNLFDPGMWTSDSSMQDIVQGLLFLMYNPDFNYPLCEVASCSTIEEFGRNVEKSIAGGRVGDYQFPVNPRYARLHPPVDKTEVDDKEEEKGDEKTDERGSGNVGKDGQIDGENDGLKDGEKDGERTGLIEEAKEGDKGERAGADGCKEDMVDRYFGIKEYISRPPDEDDEGDGDDEENYSDEEENEGSDIDSCMLSDDLNSDYDSDDVNDEDVFDLIEVDDEETERSVNDSRRFWWTKVCNLLNIIDDDETFHGSDCVISCSICEPASTRVPVLQRAQSTPVGLNHALQTRAFRRCNSEP